MNQILQQFKGQSIRIVEVDGQPYFILVDLCRVLELGNASKVASRLDEDERITLTLSEGNRGNPVVNAVNESGLYAVILRSDKPVAREFRKWVTNEILPSIRKTGSYATPVAPAPDFTQLERLAGLTSQAIENSERRVMAELDTRFQQFVDESAINHTRALEIKKGIETLARLMGGKPYHFRAAWTNFKDRFQLPAYKDLPNSKFDEAMKFIRDMAAVYETPRALEFDA